MPVSISESADGDRAAHCKGDREDHFHLEFVREPNGTGTRTDPSLI